MQLFHLYHQRRFQKFIHSEFWLFELSVWLHTFSRSMIAIFIPIFLLQIGYSIGNIVLFYFFFYAINVPLNFVARWLTRKIGARKVIILGSLFSIAFFVSLYNLAVDNWMLLIIIAFFAAAYDAFYWVAHLFLFMKCSKNDSNVSGDVSILSIVKSVAGVIAPALGALIIIFFSKNILIIVSASILAISLIPLFKIKNIPDKPEQEQISFSSFFPNWESIKDYLSKGFYHIHCTTEIVIWPLFIFIFFSSIGSVAILPIIISLTGILFTFSAGKIDKAKREKMIIFGSFFIAIIWMLRLVIENSLFYYASVFLVGLFSILITIPLDSNIFEKGEKKDALSTATYRNVFAIFFGACFYGLLSILINIFNVSFLLASSGLFFVIIISYLSGIKRYGTVTKLKKVKVLETVSEE